MSFQKTLAHNTAGLKRNQIPVQRDWKTNHDRLRKAIFVSTIFLLPVASVYADNTDAPMFSLRGFGTVGIVHSSEHNADFVGNFFQPDGAGYTRSWTMGVDSKLGVQADAQLSDKLSAVLQVVSQHRYNGSYTPAVEWANLKYQFTPDFSVRIGRNVESSFMVSDSRLVGYTYLWVRPPSEVYGLFPATNIDGIDSAYSHHFGDAANTLRGGYGRVKLKAPGGGEITAKQCFQLANTLEAGSTTVRISYQTFKGTLLNPGIDPLFDGFTQFGNAVSPFFPATGAQALALRSRYEFVDKPYSVFTVGLNYDPGNWLLMAEWAQSKKTAVVSKATAWYATGGYRFGQLTPYLTLAQLKPDRMSEAGISTAGLPPPFSTGADGLNAGLSDVINGFAFSQKSISTGVRWDFRRDADLKLQYERLRTGPDSNGRLINVQQPGFQPGKAVDLFSLAVDFVF